MVVGESEREDHTSQTTIQDPESQKEFSAVNCYFMQQDGSTFKAQVKYAPYFLLATKPNCEHDVEAFLRRRYEGRIHDVHVVEKEDLDLKNHLSGLQQKYVKVVFATVQDLMEVRREVLPMVKKNQTKCEAAEAYEALHQMEVMNGADQGGRSHHGGAGGSKGKRAIANYADAMIDIREYDVPYHMRWLIDTETRCGWWYNVKVGGNGDGDEGGGSSDDSTVSFVPSRRGCDPAAVPFHYINIVKEFHPTVRLVYSDG